MSGDRIRVLCIEDQRAFVEAMRIALGTEPDIECVDHVDNVIAGLRVLERERADVVLMDVDLPDVDGIEGTRRVKALDPTIRVVILTGMANLDLFVRAVSAGADGFLVKDGPFDAVLAAIRNEDSTGMHLDDDTIEALRVRVGEHGSVAGHAWDPYLTDREREVLSLLAAGLDAQTIARELGIRIHTCRGYVRNVLTKLGAHSQLEAVAVARHAGLLEP